MITIDDLLELSETTYRSFFVPYTKNNGGDGTDGVMSDEVLNRLKCAREIIMHKDLDTTNQDSEFHIGDIVYCENTKEHGIVLGEKPSGSLKSLAEDCADIRLGKRKRCTRMYVVLTLELLGDKGIGDTANNYDFRIRYVTSKRMTMYDKFEPIADSVSDLENFCSKQCIMTCSEDCYLYKYFKSKQKD